MPRHFRRFLDFLARRWDAAEAAKAAQWRAAKWERAHRWSERRRRQEKLEGAGVLLARDRRIAELEERTKELAQENERRQAKIDVLESQLELAGAYEELNRAKVETDLALLAAVRAEAVRRAGGEGK